MITLTVNGRPRELAAETDLASFLRDLEIDIRAVAVAHNGEVVPRDSYDDLRLRDGDSLEIVRMVGGG
ncbi:MAG: sulfur carrier protein ThiS [Dehalococcoidia bacterium]|nr:sulfur carrier protein ThiS [Dehalococcoidia bacterium]